jgi:hypothetical protein
MRAGAESADERTACETSAAFDAGERVCFIPEKRLGDLEFEHLNLLRSICDQSWNAAAGRLHEIAVFTARSASGAAAMPVIGFVRGDAQAPASDRTVHSLLNRRFRFRRIASNRGIRA